MPNEANVRSPLTLIGLGRSGTSLFQAAFANHSEFQICGETGGIIFSVWEGAKASFMPLPQRYWTLFESDQDEKCAYYVREVLNALCPSDAKHWFHKPAGLPVKHLSFKRIPGVRSALTKFPVEWYWNVLGKLFSDGRFLTIVRNPFDIMISRKEHTRWSFNETWKDIIAVYEIYEYGRNRLHHVIRFDDLIKDFEATIRKVCEGAGVAFEAQMLRALETNQAGVAKRGPVLTHRDAWNALDGFEVDRRELEVVARQWEKWGWQLDVPEKIAVR